MPTSPERGRRPRSLVALVPAVLVAAAAVTLVAPRAAGLGGTWPWVAVIAFRGALGVVALVAAAALALAALLARALAPPSSPLVRALAALAVVALATGAGEYAVLAVRGLHDGAPARAAGRGSLTVLEVNTDHSGVAPAVIARLDERAGADVVTMPETADWLARQVAERLASRGRPVQVFAVPTQGEILPTALLVSDSLGRYRQVEDTGQGAGLVVAEPVGEDASTRPRIIAAHPQAPVRPDLLAAWRSGVARAVRLCSDTTDAVLAGDFNSTLDHPPLAGSGSCPDAAATTGSAGIATWPQQLPRLVGAPLDHVLATRGRWREEAAWTEPLAGSDHRALLARLVPVAHG